MYDDNYHSSSFIKSFVQVVTAHTLGRYLRLKRRRNWSQKPILYTNLKNKVNVNIGNITTKNIDFNNGINNFVTL